VPRGQVLVPAALEALAGGRPLRAVWRNELGGLTFEIGTGADRRFVKWAPAGSALDLDGEAARLAWARAFTPVPAPVELGADEAGSWLVTAALRGESAVSARWRADPATAVRAIGSGLRALHEVLPLEDCPFSWSVEDRLADIRLGAAAGRLDPATWHEDHRGLQLQHALGLLATPPPIDKLVVCHGDACAPNTLLDDDGRWSAHVDLGALGTADRWADLAVATWSTTWNYRPGWEDALLDAYGIDPDAHRMRSYRLLWDLGP
jgi:kanamycin kinase